MTLPTTVGRIEERATLGSLLMGKSIARYGDGELRLALGGSVGHQQGSNKMAEELRHILWNPTKCLVGVPYINENSPKIDTWKHYSNPKFQALYNPDKIYHSAFITRPDSAPWIDKPQYWDAVKSLWRDKDIVIVNGSNKGFRFEEMLATGARTVSSIFTLPEQAYAQIDEIEKEICLHDINKIILLAVGATATVLAWRLSEKGYHALDLGHIAMFMRRRGLFNDSGK